MSQINHSELEPDGDASELYSHRRSRRIRIVAWTVIIAMIVTGGGASAFALLFG